MKDATIIKKGSLIAEQLFNSTELKLSKEDLLLIITSEAEEYAEQIINGVISIDKIAKARGPRGGIVYVHKKNGRASLTKAECIQIEKTIASNLKKTAKKKKNKQPESAVEAGFFEYLKDMRTSGGVIINSRSSARRRGKWHNVDGYEVRTLQYKYHFLYKPFLTCYEVKAHFPSEMDMAQTKKYLDFSNQAYLVFNDPRSTKEVSDELFTKGLLKPSDKIGVYYTQDNIEYKRLKKAVYTQLNEKHVDEAIDELLSDDDKDALKKMKLDYLRDNFVDLLSILE